jgi:hypothetical protein
MRSIPAIVFVLFVVFVFRIHALTSTTLVKTIVESVARTGTNNTIGNFTIPADYVTGLSMQLNWTGTANSTDITKITNGVRVQLRTAVGVVEFGAEVVTITNTSATTFTMISALGTLNTAQIAAATVFVPNATFYFVLMIDHVETTVTSLNVFYELKYNSSLAVTSSSSSSSSSSTGVASSSTSSVISSSSSSSSSSNSTTATSDSENAWDKLKPDARAGIILACIVAFALLALGIFACFCRGSMAASETLAYINARMPTRYSRV